MTKPRCILSVDVEAFPIRASDRHIDTLIYGRFNGDEYGIGRMMDIADKYEIKMTFFLDFAEVELYGDEIIQVGKYIVSRGHDLQVHCHIDFVQTVKECFPNTNELFQTWYHNEEISDFMINYCLEQYYKCRPNDPAVYRGGAYRFAAPLLKILKKKGFKADATYNMLRPIPLPPQKQFFYENGLLELPIGIVPETGTQKAKQLSFNADELYPMCENDWKYNLGAYERLFAEYYQYFGTNAIASLIMHSWSFCHEYKRFHETGYIDRPNPYAVDLFDRFLDHFKDQIDFITAAQAVQAECGKHLKTEQFAAVFLHQEIYSQKNLKRIFDYVRNKADGREIIVWGKGWTESVIFCSHGNFTDLNVKAYISRDAEYSRIWRGRPVKTFEEAQITPKTHYVFVCAQPIFPEIREMLRKAGFEEYSDYYDFAKFAVQG